MATRIDLGDGKIGVVTHSKPGLDTWAIMTTEGAVIHTGYAKLGEAEGMMRAFLDTGEATPYEPETEEVTAPVEEPEDEPEQRLKGKLPDGFPGKSALEAAGYGTYAKVRKLYEKGELTDVPGIGDPTAERIAEVFTAE